MSGLAALLAGREAPGVYRWESALDAADIASAVEGAGWAFAHVDGWTRGAIKADFLAEVGVALDFPAHYGRNLDALVDCLRDVGADGRGTVVLWDGWSTLARADRRTFDVVVDILAERAHGEGARFAVLLRGDGPDLFESDLLD
jgi:RNAse (barnase) inhibitor barstar